MVVLLSPWGLAGGGLLGCATSKSQGCTRQCLPPTVSHLGPPGSAHQPCGTATIGCSLTAVRCAPKGLDISSGTWMTKTPPHDFCVSGCFATFRARDSCARAGAEFSNFPNFYGDPPFTDAMLDAPKQGSGALGDMSLNLTYREGGGSSGDNFRGEKCAFQIGDEICPAIFFLRTLGHFLFFVYPPWRRLPGIVALLSAVSVRVSRPFILLALE